MRRLGRVYEEVRGRIADLVAGLDDFAASTTVPACPDWSVHDVVAHMAGVCSDVLSGNVAGAATNSWTAAQVETRRDRPLAEVLTEWEDAGSKVALMVDDFPGRYGDQLVSDVTTHEHDIRGALDRPGARESDGVAICADFLVTVILGSAMTAFGLKPLEIRAGDRTWIVSTGDAPTGDRDAWRDALLSEAPNLTTSIAPAGIFTVEPFELCRAGSGRRSAAQIRRFEWTTEPEPYLAIFGYGPFTVRPTDLHE